MFLGPIPKCILLSQHFAYCKICVLRSGFTPAVISFFSFPVDTTRQPRPGEVNGKGEPEAVGSVSLDSPNNSGFQSWALILGAVLGCWVI